MENGQKNNNNRAGKYIGKQRELSGDTGGSADTSEYPRERLE
jgi:hypothetical protein